MKGDKAVQELTFKSLKGKVSDKEWQLRVDLAACYRDSGNSYFSAGATGRGVRSIARYLCDL